MYRVLIVDDEYIVREGMRNKINWAEHGFFEADTAVDGRDAIEKIEKNCPHLVLTDIYMPFINGLELSEYLYTNFPSIKTVIITGYDDFDYARKALKFKVFDYILKPMTSEELNEIIKKVKAELDSESEKTLELSSLRKLLEENRSVIKDMFLDRFVNGVLSEDEALPKLDYFDIDRSAGSYVIAVIDIDSSIKRNPDFSEYGDELLYYSVYNVSEELLGDASCKETEGAVIFRNQLSQSVIIFWGENSLKNCEETSKTILRKMKDILNFSVSIGISRIFRDIFSVNSYYEEAKAALEHRFIIGSNRIINITDVTSNFSKEMPNDEELGSKLILAIKTGEKETVAGGVSDLFSAIRQSELSVDSCYTVIQSILFKIQYLMMQLEFDVSKITSAKSNLLVELYNYQTLDDIENWLKTVCGAVNEYIASQRNSYSETLVLKAQEFIAESFANPEINVNTVSKHLSISTSYFSNIFKAKTQETFIEYLTRIRLEKAKELLKTTGLKTYEISDKIGYTDSHYFSISFKKHVGMTPTQYRESDSD